MHEEKKLPGRTTPGRERKAKQVPEGTPSPENRQLNL
jgi:hypothetical protein